MLIRSISPTDLAPEIPEDLYHLIKKAVAIHKHLAVNRKDMDSKFRMVLIEARIHRCVPVLTALILPLLQTCLPSLHPSAPPPSLVRYYITAGQLPPNFKYEADKASALVS